MLVLTRNVEQEVIIGDKGDIRVQVLSIDGNQVKLGFSAARDVAIHRSEIYQRILEERGEEAQEGSSRNYSNNEAQGQNEACGYERE